MWKKLQKNIPYYILFNQKSDYEIYITDYITIWSCYLTENCFLSILKESNPDLQITNNEIIEKGTHMLLNTEDLKRCTLVKEDTTLVVSMCKLYGYPLKLMFSLLEDSKEVFFQMVTQQLLGNVKDLKDKVLKLCQLLKEKDEEIEKYKDEGGKIRKHWRTVPFNEEIISCDNEVESLLLQDIPQNLLESKERKNHNDVKQETTETANTSIKTDVIEPKYEVVISKTSISQIKEENTIESQSSLIPQIKQEWIKSEPEYNSSIPKKMKKRNLNL